MTNTPVPRAITDLVERTFAIPGVQVVKVGWLDETRVGSPIPAKRQLDVSAFGWGPTLHRRHRVWRQDVAKAVRRQRLVAEGSTPEEADAAIAAGPVHGLPALDAALSMTDPEACAAALAACLEPVAEVQRRLAAHAAAHGIDKPLAPPTDALRGGIGGSDLQRTLDQPALLARLADALLLHHIDRRLADALVDVRGPAGAAGLLAAGLASMLQTDDGVFDDSLADQQGTFGANLSDDGPRVWGVVQIGRVAPDRLKLRPAPFDDGPTFDGDNLILEQALPESACASLVGRPVSTLAATGHASLDAATIEGVERRDEHVVVTLVTDDVAIADHPVLGPALRDMAS